MKAGTTSLYNYLRDHPQVFMPTTKEVNFFNPLKNWPRGIEWYEQQFEGANGAVAIGEASTSYAKFPWIEGVPTRIASVLEDVKFIYVLRHPVDRMQSHYLHNLATGQEWRPIDEAFRAEPMYLNISRYALQLDQYMPVFPRDRFMVIDSRDLRYDRKATLRRIFAHLGIDEEWVPPVIDSEFFRSSDRQMKPSLLRRIRRIPNIQAISRFVPRPIKRLPIRLPWEELDRERGYLPDDLRRTLEDSLRGDVARLRAYMGNDFDGWGIG
jgi:hypothetical protein